MKLLSVCLLTLIVATPSSAQPLPAPPGTTVVVPAATAAQVDALIFEMKRHNNDMEDKLSILRRDQGKIGKDVKQLKKRVKALEEGRIPVVPGPVVATNAPPPPIVHVYQMNLALYLPPNTYHPYPCHCGCGGWGGYVPPPGPSYYLSPYYTRR